MYFFFLLHEIFDKEKIIWKKNFKMMGRKSVNVDAPNAWWHSRNLFKSWEFKSKADGLQATFFYTKICLPVTCWVPIPSVSLRNKSACEPGSVLLLWAAEIIAASRTEPGQNLQSFALPINELKISMCQGVAGRWRICTLLSLAFCLMHNFEVPRLAVTSIIKWQLLKVI